MLFFLSFGSILKTTKIFNVDLRTETYFVSHDDDDLRWQLSELINN